MKADREKLEASIKALEQERFDNQMISYRLFLDPEKSEVWVFTCVGAGTPMRAYHNVDVGCWDIPYRAIPESVVEYALNRIDWMISKIERFQGTEWRDGNHWGVWDELEDADGYDSTHVHHLHFDEIACYWDPGDWYELSTHEIEQLAKAGKTAKQIVDELGTGDLYNGMVDEGEAIAFITERLEDLKEDDEDH
jgi:hypothetical protein